MFEQAFEEQMEHLAGLVNGEMRRQLDRTFQQAIWPRNPDVRQVFESVYAYLDNGGKRMHGISVLLAYGAVSGKPLEPMLPVAAGFQLYHHHTLVHDDIYDQDDLRRGLPTLHRAFSQQYGPSLQPTSLKKTNPVFASAAERVGAVTAWAQGKIVHALSLESIFSAPFAPNVLCEVAQRLNRHDFADNAGQIMDVLNEDQAIADPDACLEIARVKTGRLFATGVECAVTLAGGSESQMEALGTWIERVATAYQLQDDLNDLEGDSEKGKGRGVGRDLLSNKPTYLFALAKQRAAGRAKEVLQRWQGTVDANAASIDEVIAAIQNTGAITACHAKAQELVDAGEACLVHAIPRLPSAEIEFMRQFGAYFTSTSYWKRDLKIAV